uniref:Putative Mg2+ and Co2+ transporter CorD n=1 Tax=Glossina morsitans morsitans TaxID=37546 RepID=D3TPU8_GLOMM
MGFLQQMLLSRCAPPLMFIIKRTVKKQNSNPTRLAEVGRLETIKLDGKYETGQLFLHRIFGYRGVVLFPWTARVYDRDLHSQTKPTQSTKATTAQPPQTTISQSPPINSNTAATSTATEESKSAAGQEYTPPKSSTNAAESVSAALKSQLSEVVNTLNSAVSSSTSSTSSTASKSATETKSNTPSGSSSTSTSSNTSSSTASPSKDSNSKEIRGKVHTFYQVLIDSRDCPYIRAQTEAVTFLGSQDSNRSLYAIPGLDYVSHDDIMPYSSTDKLPLHHELFDKFLNHVPEKQPTFEAKDTLKSWQDKNHPWLELSDVHKETTENIRVTVIPFYMGCRETPASSVYWWRYSIRLENLGMMSVQLRERHWRIFSLSGTLETVRGRGVVGQEPILSPRLPAFQYSSHVSLQAPSGHMWGTFRLEREDGHMFDCKIPPFSLESKPEDPITGQPIKMD